MKTEVKERFVKNLVENTKGRFFKVSFRKKDGTVRDMTCRIGVKAHMTTNKERHFDHGAVVWDTTKEQYRTVLYASVLYFKCGSTEVWPG